jgi:PTH1 family peptidyl-tRNA hydrolase
LVVGLGNPGETYRGTRHNVGAEVVRVLADRHGARLRGFRQLAEVDEVAVDGRRLALATPRTYMNESGQAVAPLCHRFGVDDPERLVIVHDELDLEPGRIKVKVGGGLAGHNGLRSIKAHLKTQGFVRIRVGVGKPPTKERGADHVLRPPSRRDRDELAVAVQEAADAVETILADGPDVAMNRFN